MRVTGIPKGGKRIQFFEGLTLRLPGGAVYYTDDEDNFCISMPEVPAQAGMTELPDDAETRWSITQLREQGNMSFEAEDGADLSNLPNLVRDAIEELANGVAQSMSESMMGMLGPLAESMGESLPEDGIQPQYESRISAADENRIVACICGGNGWLDSRYLPGAFIIGIPHYPENVTLYIGQYGGMDDSVFENEFLPMLNSARAGGQAEEAAVQDDGGLGSFAGANGKLDALKALALFENDVIFFNEGDIHWDGERHTIASIQLNAEKVDENRALMKRAQAVIEGLNDLASYLENNPKLRVPAARLHSRMREFLHGEDLTGMMFFHLSAWHQFWLMESDQVSEDADGKDVVMLDVNFPKAVPGCRELIQELLRTLRAYNGITGPRETVFSNVRNLDRTEPFDGDLLEYETLPEPEEDDTQEELSETDQEEPAITQATGVAPGGETVTLFPGLRIHIPYGAAYTRDEDGDYNIFRFACTPPEYRAGDFTVEGELETVWKISGLGDGRRIDYPEGKVPDSPEETQAVMRRLLEQLAINMTGEDEGANEPYVPGSSTQVEETEDGFTIRSTISSANAGGSYEIMDLSGGKTVALVQKEIRIFGFGFTMNYAIVLANWGGGMNCYSVTVSAEGEGLERFKRTIVPVLQTLEVTAAALAAPPDDEPAGSAARPGSIPDVEFTANISADSDIEPTVTMRELNQREVPQEQGYGRFAGADGRLDAFMGIAFFTEDVIFFHREDLVWDGKHHSFVNYRFNSGVLANAEGVLEHSQAIIEGLTELIAELESNEELRVPAEDLHPEMRRFLNGADFTPAVVFYMECFNWFRFGEDEPDKYGFVLEERLAKSFYSDPYKDFDYPYFEKFIGALRAYNGNHKPYKAACTGTFGGQTGEHLPDIRLQEYVMNEDGYPLEDAEGNWIYRKKTPEELEWETRMRRKAVQAELAKVPFDRVSSVTVSGSTFVLTGDFEKNPEDRDAVKRLIEAKGGRCTGSVSGKTNYLVIGALGDFGQRKIEQVQEQRAKGKTIKIIREGDLMAALESRTAAPPPAPAKPAAYKPAAAPSKPTAPAPKKADSGVEALRARALAAIDSCTEPEYQADARRIIGEILTGELMTWKEIKERLGGNIDVRRLVPALLKNPYVQTGTVTQTGSLGGIELSAFRLGERDGWFEPVAPKPPAPAPAKPVAPAPKQEDEQAKYRKAVEIMKAEVQKAIDQTKQEVVDQKAEVERLRQEKTAAEQKLNSLGFFKFAEKTAAREEIARCAKAVADAEQKLGSIRAERMHKVKQVLDKHPLPDPPAPSAAYRSTSVMKSTSAATAEKVREIASVLRHSPMTAAEINRALNQDYTALQIANACKFISGTATVKVFRIETDKEGEPVLKEYNAYYLV